MEGVFANRSEKRDFVINELERRATDECPVYIASAFFTHSDVVERMLQKGCRGLMAIRLGFPTSPFAIEKVKGHPNLQLRIYTGHAFHPKLYIFGDELALVGSANLTQAALLTNQEVMVSIRSTTQGSWNSWQSSRTTGTELTFLRMNSSPSIRKFLSRTSSIKRGPTSSPRRCSNSSATSRLPTSTEAMPSPRNPRYFSPTSDATTRKQFPPSTSSATPTRPAATARRRRPRYRCASKSTPSSVGYGRGSRQENLGSPVHFGLPRSRRSSLAT